MVSFYILVALFVSLTSQAPLHTSTSLRLVLKDNFPDPALIKVGNLFYAFATTNGKQNVPVAVSKDFVNWEITGVDALPEVPSWSDGGIWAPDVVQLVRYRHWFQGRSHWLTRIG